MKKSDIYEITIKILGLYLFATYVIGGIESVFANIFYITQVQGNLSGENNENWTAILVISIVNLVLLVSVASFMFFKANYIIRKICSTTDFEENAKFFAEPKVIYEIALTVTALFLIIWTLPEFSFNLEKYYESNFKSSVSIKYEWILTARILIGIFLLLFARRIAGYFGKTKKLSEE